MKTLTVLVALLAETIPGLTQPAAITVDHHYEDKGKRMDVFTVTNQDRSRATAYVLKIEYHNATTGKLEWDTHWFDSLLKPVQNQSLQQGESQRIRFVPRTNETLATATIIGVIFEDGRSLGDSDVVNALYTARRAVLSEIPDVIETIQEWMSSTNGLSSLAEALQARAHTSYQARLAEGGAKSLENEAIGLYYRSLDKRVATQAATLLKTVLGMQLSDRETKVIEMLKDWEERLYQSIRR